MQSRGTYNKIIERFPEGSVSAYIRKCFEDGKDIDENKVINELMNISTGTSKDVKYIDDSSKLAARHFIGKLRS